MMVDAIVTEIVMSRIAEVAAAMEHALYHAGYSPILRESRDGTAGLTDDIGRVLMVGGGLQFHTIPYMQAVRSVCDRFPIGSMRAGDSYIVNDPYLCGNPHVPDMVAVTPVFFDGAVIAFAVSIAHKSDLGGLVPGSSGAGSREIFHDGLRLPPVLFRSSEGFIQCVEDIIRLNSRTPDIVLGDLRGQIGATQVGAERLCLLCDEYGSDVVCEVMRRILAFAAMRLGRELSVLPDGDAECEGFLDHDGADLSTPVRIAVQVRKRGDRLVIDFSGSAGQTQGPVNLTPWTARSVSLLAVLAATDPSIPVNSGLLDNVEVTLPLASVVNPSFPATVNLYFPTAVMAYTCVLTAMGKLNPSRKVAPSGMVTGAISLGYRAHGAEDAKVQYELALTGLGGTNVKDGTCMVTPINHFTAGSPVEIVETEYPVLVRRYDIWQDSAGPGRFRGGIGYVRELQVLQDCSLTLRSAGHRSSAWGLDGGGGPATSRTVINPGAPSERALDAIATAQMKAGDILQICRSGGSGCSNPFERDLKDVCLDVEDGYVSVEAARSAYGVATYPDGTPDMLATNALRNDSNLIKLR